MSAVYTNRTFLCCFSADFLVKGEGKYRGKRPVKPNLRLTWAHFCAILKELSCFKVKVEKGETKKGRKKMGASAIEEKIERELRTVEEQENVRVLYAIESGSRAWGFASPDSDYDVRFIYVRSRREYLRLNAPRDVIEHVLNEELDINGWDLSKALKLLHSSNPTLFEWLNSPIVYRTSEEIGEIKALAGAYFSATKGICHYLHMAQGNYRQFLSGEMVKLKKYFYVMRPILASRHILKRGTPPPMLFSELVEDYLEPELKNAVADLLQRKTEEPETKFIPRIDVLNEWIERQFELLRAETSRLPSVGNGNWEKLNDLFYRCLKVRG